MPDPGPPGWRCFGGDAHGDASFRNAMASIFPAAMLHCADAGTGGTMKRGAIVFLLLAGLSAPVAAGTAKGTAAYERGDFAVAHREFLAPS